MMFSSSRNIWTDIVVLAVYCIDCMVKQVLYYLDFGFIEAGYVFAASCTKKARTSARAGSTNNVTQRDLLFRSMHRSKLSRWG